jgi:hypothetical protein
MEERLPNLGFFSLSQEIRNKIYEHLIDDKFAAQPVLRFTNSMGSGRDLALAPQLPFYRHISETKTSYNLRLTRSRLYKTLVRAFASQLASHVPQVVRPGDIQPQAYTAEASAPLLSNTREFADTDLGTSCSLKSTAVCRQNARAFPLEERIRNPHNTQSAPFSRSLLGSK